MKWLVFSYSLPAKLSSSSRVRIWRKLRKSGAVSPKAGVHVLPYTKDCREAVRWLVSEVAKEQGEALVMQVDRFENIPNDKVIDIFRKQRAADYQEIEACLFELEQMIQAGQANREDNLLAFKRDIKRIKKSIDEVSKIDFFFSYDKRVLLDRLHRLQKSLMTGNLIMLILFSIATLETTVLPRMKEESR